RAFRLPGSMQKDGSMKTQPPAAPSGLGFDVVGNAELRLSGTLVGPEAQEYLSGRLTELHQRLAKAAVTTFTVDVRNLAFVNSSAIRAFVDWTSRAETAGYKLVFLTEPSITWHRLSFSVLKSLAPDTVEVVAGAASSRRGVERS